MDPPYYILFSTQPANSSSLGHPTIQYQYADDSPLALLPQHPDEHVLLLEFDQTSSVPTVTSTSRTLAVTGIKVEEAPGAAVAEDKHNDRMYIIEATTAPVEDKLHYNFRANVLRLTPFLPSSNKGKNLAIRQALNYPEGLGKSSGLATVSTVKGLSP
ncbi:hypothetical protein EV361DRAFT_949791 [Lentinula raphanica]|nr:hypothetical protein C8R42DRAFT_722410 [Lentinula raphanica]KAJ3823903.1 hypothetical protein F5880DRAFT_1612489 [Lentinula raphanica]KAJ3971334.1 hypothetical protein EV361DRAFT_949791 [Lentinula raphanica]